MKSFLAGIAALFMVAPAAADYLSESGRAEVEALKAAYRGSPTTPASYPERAAIAWRWLNAFAMTGASIPVNMTTAIRPNLPDGPRQGNARSLDYYLEELILLDEEPAALGQLEADKGPFEARSYAEVRQRWTVGSRGVTKGGGFLVARHFMPGYGVFQTDAPAKANYVSIRADREGVSFVADGRPLAGMHGGFRGARPALFFRLSAGELQPGDVVTVTYGDQGGGGPGLQMGPASTDFLPLPIYVDFDGGGHSFALPIQPVAVRGTALAGVHAFAPSVVRRGESFEISVRAQDRFYNRAAGPFPAFVVRANGLLVGEVAAGPDAINILRASFDEPGVYRLTVASVDGRVRGVGNPVLVDADATRVFWGDTHGHSGFAEGIGTPERFMRWAKDDARLDFVTHSEHDIWMDDYEWRVLRDVVRRFSEPGRFVAYHGYEWTTQNRYGGHHNVLFRETEGSRVPVQFHPTISALYAGLRATHDVDDVVVIPHAHQSGDYRQSDPELQDLIEIMSQHGTFEWFGRKYLEHGHQVGFIAASDNHLSQPGYTSPWRGAMSQRGGLAAVLADEHGRDPIFDAMKARHTYATTGDKIILDFELNGGTMGDRVRFAESRQLTGRVIGTAPIHTVTVLKNLEPIYERRYLANAESVPGNGEGVFYLSFESDSVPMHPQDNARGTRTWRGTIDVENAELESFEATDFFNPEVNRLERDAELPNRIHFVTGSRGDASSIRLTLEKVKRSARLRVRTEAATEYGSPTRFRLPGTTPAGESVLRLRDMREGELKKVIPVDIYDDAIVLRHAVTEGPDDVTFELTDTGAIQGDHYYVRVRLANDAMAWSSPIWVGGFPPR
ncbi:MAG: hypothetical protein CMD83_17555 [Gammaproteobacteria bacterium]|nr:hypothetical protein [Gammaproteobacteria bacterium]